MHLYYLPLLIRSDRYFIAKLDSDEVEGNRQETDFNFVIPVEERVVVPIITLEDPSRLTLNQMAPSGLQDVNLTECSLELKDDAGRYELIIRKTGKFHVVQSAGLASGLRLDYSASQKRITLGYYTHRATNFNCSLHISLHLDDNTVCSARYELAMVPAPACNRVVIDFGSESSQVGYRNCGPQSAVMQYDILENLVSQLQLQEPGRHYRREEFLNQEQGQPLLYRTFFAVKKRISETERERFPFNFHKDIRQDEVRLFITRQEVAATSVDFRDNYEIIPNLKLGIERSLQMIVGAQSEDYSIRTHKHQLISAILLRLLRLMISTKPEFRSGGIIVTLLVPNIYTQHDVFSLLNELRLRTAALMDSLSLPGNPPAVEYETISESDAAFMGYQQTSGNDVRLVNGDMALVIDCGKGTTDISIVMADDNENYSSFFRTGFAGAGNVLSYAFIEDFLSLVLKVIPGTNELSVRDFITRQIIGQNLTVDVLGFLQLVENIKKRYKTLEPVSIAGFANLSEAGPGSERTIANLHRDQSTLLQYAEAILRDRSVRWDDEITGLVHRATDCIVHCILSSISDVLTRDIRKRIKVIMLSGRAFYFDELREKTEKGLLALLGSGVRVNTMPAGRALNNKNVAIHGAFTGAYKITDFTGIPIDKKEGLSKNNDVLNNNMFLYRGIKIQPGNDIIYNTALVRRNNQQLKSFRNKTVDIYFTRDNIYLRLMENQRVQDVRSLYSILTSLAEVYSPLQDMKDISTFPSGTSELASINSVHADMHNRQEEQRGQQPAPRKTILNFINF